MTSTSPSSRARSSGSRASSDPGAARCSTASSGSSGRPAASSRSTAAHARIRDPLSAIRAGIGYVPADRKTRGLVLDMSVQANLLMAQSCQTARLRRPRRGAEERAVARRRRALPDRQRLGGDAGRAPERRQPAEGRAREVAGDASRGCCCSTSRRAASTSARRPRSTARSERSRTSGVGHPAELVRDARAAAALRPDPDHVPGPDHRGVAARGRHRSADHALRDGARMSDTDTGTDAGTGASAQPSADVANVAAAARERSWPAPAARAAPRSGCDSWPC